MPVVPVLFDVFHWLGKPRGPPEETLKGEISGNYLWGNSSRVPEKFEFLMRSPILPITTPLAYLRGICHFFFNLAIYSPSPGSSSNTTLFEYKTWDNNIDFRTIIAKPDSPRGPTPIISHREMMFFTRTRGKLFSISPVPYPRDRTKSPSLKNWTCLGSFPRDVKRWNWTWLARNSYITTLRCSPSFSLMDSRAIESSRVSPFSRGVIFTRTHVFRSFPPWSFARPTIPDEKWENTRGPWVVKDCGSLNRVQCKWKSFTSAINKNIKVIIKKILEHQRWTTRINNEWIYLHS